MKRLEKQSYKLFNTIQNYDWGTKGDEAFIPRLLGAEPEMDVPYAELWIGAHPKAPSSIKINSEEYRLDELIKEYPSEILGEYVSSKFGNKLPYLLKVLSSRKSLSIQAHPDKELAKELHRKDPANYPDENHKPEIAITIDNLEVIAGFKPFEEIKKLLSEYPELIELIGSDIAEELKENDISDEVKTRMIYKSVMKLKNEEPEKVILALKDKIDKKENKNASEKQFLTEYENYGADVGLISVLMLNYLSLNEGEAIFIGAGIPHAYIKGNIIECMANSDNVVRAGLTPKYKDVDTLLGMLVYKGGRIPVIKPPVDQSEFVYDSRAEEFRITRLKFDKRHSETYRDNDKIIIGIVLTGEIQISQNEKSGSYVKGESFLIPAVMNNFVINNYAGSEYYIVEVP